MVDSGFLAKCEEFLLHPRVREFSLAQRVDFLENKGLSPDEITACLKNVQLRNGLARAITPHVAATEGGGVLSMFGRENSTLTWSQWLLLHGGAAAVVLLLTHGFQRVRHRMEEEAASAQRAERLRQRAGRNTRVAAMLVTLTERQQQYTQAMNRLRERAQGLQRARAAVRTKRQAQQTAGVHTHATKSSEVAALEQQVATLKLAVLHAFTAPTTQPKEESTPTQTDAAQGRSTPPVHMPVTEAPLPSDASPLETISDSEVELDAPHSFVAHTRPLAVT